MIEDVEQQVFERKAKELVDNYNIIKHYANIVQAILSDMRAEAHISPNMMKFAESNPKFLLAVMTQELVNIVGIHDVCFIVESSLKHFELDVIDHLKNKDSQHHDGATCYLKNENVKPQIPALGLPPRAPPPDVKLKKKKNLNIIKAQSFENKINNPLVQSSNPLDE